MSEADTSSEAGRDARLRVAMPDGSGMNVRLFQRAAFVAEVENAGNTVELAVPDPVAEVIIVEQKNGRTDSLRATCAKVDELIDAYEDSLNGGGLFGGVVNTYPGLRTKIESSLRDAKAFKAQVCDPVLKA